ncbi:MAG: hypothetical protein HZA08_07915 [Nitrospirae bacterium]|nr:hypothetical protein [Nitrospirota bacterium]
MIKKSGLGIFMITCLTSLTVLLIPEFASAHRPLTTQTAYPVDIHRVRLESGLRYNNFPDGNESYDVDIELNYGVVNNLDIGIEVPFVFWRPEQGEQFNTSGDMILKSRLLFLKGREGNPITLTIQPFFKLPTPENKLSKLQSGPGFSTGETDFGFLFIAERELSSLTKALMNIGYVFINRPDFGTNYQNIFIFKLAMENKLDNNLEVVGELTGATNENRNKDDIFTVMIGARKQIRNGISVDAGYSTGLSDVGPDSVLTMGVTKEF